MYDVAPRLTDGTVVLDTFAPEDAVSHLAGEDEELARGFGWFPHRSTLAGVRETIARWHDQWCAQGPVRAFAAHNSSPASLGPFGVDGQMQAGPTHAPSLKCYGAHYALLQPEPKGPCDVPTDQGRRAFGEARRKTLPQRITIQET